MAEYGFDLAAEMETVSARRLWVLVKGLPSDSALWRDRVWTRQDEFAAAQLELTDAWSRLIFTALGGKPRGRPLEVERPGLPDQPEKKREITTDTQEIARFFAMTA